MMPDTLGSMFLRAAEFDTATVDFWRPRQTPESYSYAQLASEALLVAGALQRRGLRKGDRVALVLPTHPDFYRAFFGVICAGGIPAALYPAVRLGRVEAWQQRTMAMLQALSCVAVLTQARLRSLLEEPMRLVAPRLGCLTVEALLQDGYQGTCAEARHDELALVQFSSGTTVTPKPIALTHAHVLQHAHTVLALFPGAMSAHSGVSWLPLYHDMGLIGYLVGAMIIPAPLTLIRPEHFAARPRLWLEALTSTRATTSAAPSFALSLCCDSVGVDELDGLDLSAWQIVLCGGEAVHQQTLDRFARHFAAVGLPQHALTPVYGLAEATLAVTFAPIDRPPLSTRFHRDALEQEGRAVAHPEGIPLVSVGQPIPGAEVEIRDATGQARPSACIGRIWMRGPGVMVGYLDMPRETQQVVQDGWLDTGDRGFLYRGNLYICGRDKDVIILRGRNYDPAYIEQSLEDLAGVCPGGVVAFGDADTSGGTERLVLLVEYRAKHLPSDLPSFTAQIRARVLERCQLRIADLALLPPGRVPRTSSGKVRRREAHRLWQEERREPRGPVGLRQGSSGGEVG